MPILVAEWQGIGGFLVELNS